MDAKTILTPGAGIDPERKRRARRDSLAAFGVCWTRIELPTFRFVAGAKTLRKRLVLIILLASKCLMVLRILPQFSASTVWNIRRFLRGVNGRIYN